MPRKRKKTPKLPSLLVEETADDERLFLESLERLDPKAVARKSAGEPEEPAPRPAKTRSAGPWEIDLHGLTVEEARHAVDRIVAELLGAGAGGEATLKVITGKGRHSGPQGSVLAREIHRHIARAYAGRIVSLEESPADVVVGDLPLRGHFHVVFRR